MVPTCTQSEGFVLGVGAKMFTIAGPVVVYGTDAVFNMLFSSSIRSCVGSGELLNGKLIPILSYFT